MAFSGKIKLIKAKKKLNELQKTFRDQVIDFSFGLIRITVINVLKYSVLFYV
jgi:hypothetical protein